MDRLLGFAARWRSDGVAAILVGRSKYRDRNAVVFPALGPFCFKQLQRARVDGVFFVDGHDNAGEDNREG